MDVFKRHTINIWINHWCQNCFFKSRCWRLSAMLRARDRAGTSNWVDLFRHILLMTYQRSSTHLEFNITLSVYVAFLIWFYSVFIELLTQAFHVYCFFFHHIYCIQDQKIISWLGCLWRRISSLYVELQQFQYFTIPADLCTIEWQFNGIRVGSERLPFKLISQSSMLFTFRMECICAASCLQIPASIWSAGGTGRSSESSSLCTCAVHPA